MTADRLLDVAPLPGHEREDASTPEPLDDVIEGKIVDSPARAADLLRAAIAHAHARAAARHTAYVGLGGLVTARRLWDARTTARYDRFIREAEAAGDREGALEWEDRRARFIRERHARRMDWIEFPGRVLVKVPWIAGGTGAFLGAIGLSIAIARRDPADVVLPFEFVAALITWIVFVASVTWGWLLTAAGVITIAALWHAGRTAAATGTGPGWVRTSADADLDIGVDETTIAQALEALRIAQIRDYLRAGYKLQYLVPCRTDGRGTYCRIRLPKGVPADRIVRRRPDLASGLYRQTKEVWPTTGDEAGVLDLWVADKGALAEGAGPYPLLADGYTDVFKGLPFGRTLRGDLVRIPVTGRNTICGGMPDQGKSSAARVVAAGYALDPTAEIRIYVPDANYDFEVFRPRCSRYIMGADDEQIARILDELRELHAEVQARGELLIEYGEPEVTRELASAGVGLHPLFVLVEEAHVAIQHPEHGKEIARLLGEITKLDRKRCIHLFVSTQAPVRGAMPADVTRNCANGIAFAVGDHYANDALLGAGAYSGGHRATELIPGADVGTALCKGFSGQRSELVQAHFISVRRGNDQVTPLINRVLAELRRRGKPVPGSDGASLPAARELLDDLQEVLGTQRVKVRDAVGLLRGLAPAWGAYRSMTATRLRELLAAENVRVINSSGIYYLDPADLSAAVEQKATADLDEEPPWK